MALSSGLQLAADAWNILSETLCNVLDNFVTPLNNIV